MQTRFVSFLALASLLSAGALGAQTVYVTTVADTSDFGGAKMVGDLPGPDGVVSMREAALATSNTPGPQTIGFQVPVAGWGTGTTGPKIINASQPFAIDGDDTTIDGTTQTAFTGDTNPDGAEVSFHSTTTEIPLIQTGIFEINSDRNLILGLGDMTGRNYGIDILPESSENVVKACVISAKFAAVRVRGDDNLIGGTGPSDGNRLDSLSDGLRIQTIGIDDPATGNLVYGNELTGEFNGVQIIGPTTNNRIGGHGIGEGNLISGAGYLQEDGTPDGAMVRIEADGNFVIGNLIGTDASGAAVDDNIGDVGVEIYGDGNEIESNVIGGITGLIGPLSVQAGVSLREGAENNLVINNWIGVDKTGSIPLSNGVGVQIGPFDASLPAPLGNTIENNAIAFNEQGGVRVLSTAAGNSILGNEIRDNHAAGGIGIDLGGDGPTPNDPGDVDSGPNDLMNFPALESAVLGALGTVAIGRLDTASPETALVEVFTNGTPAPGEIVEARAPLGSTTPRPDGRFALLVAPIPGEVLTATATGAQGSTSEIGPFEALVPTPWVDLGLGTPGTHLVPNLAGGGTLAPGTDFALVLLDAREQAPGIFVLSTTPAPIVILGATLVPSPQVLVPFTTGTSGSATFLAVTPLVPTGTPIFAQAGVLDPQGPQGVAASNAIVGVVP